MKSLINPNLLNTFAPPVMESRRWLDGISFCDENPLINLSQAAPTLPPPLPLRQAIADLALNDPAAHLYGPVLGLTDLRSEIAKQWSDAYSAHISSDAVAITSGCNQAFCAAIATVARAGDAVLVPSPWYFNHKMWLDMAGIECRPLPCGADMMPSPDAAANLLDNSIKAIVLVTPNNPTGVEYPDSLLSSFYKLAKSRGIALIVDETYRDFDSRNQRPHDLFSKDNWGETLIQLYSFSKAFRMTGHRIGAMVTGPNRLAEAEKFLDTVTICPNQLGQRAALFGMQNLSGWLSGERDEILSRRAAIEDQMPKLNGWRLLGAGAYFAYVEHPFAMSSLELAKTLVREAGVLMLPGTMFSPSAAEGGDGRAKRQLRIAFANVDQSGITELFRRLKTFTANHPLVSKQ